MARSDRLVNIAERLANSTNIGDRAFAASLLGLTPTATDRDRAAYLRVRETALSIHAEVRARIRAGSLEREAFVARLLAEPPQVRDQLVEEILDIASPPFELLNGTHGAAGYSPSGIAEVLFLLEQAKLGPGSAFVDLGSGLGKVVLLVALLTGAQAVGIEHDAALVAHARGAAEALGLAGARFIAADLREAALPPADAYYMFMPSADAADIVARLAPSAGTREFLLFAQRLDPERFGWLRAREASCYWLECYESRAPRR
jgi:protein-L-isoaspartate O-methyltransferase